jgi:hypothetical protein
MPYLLRRAEENADMLSGVGDEVRARAPSSLVEWQ